MAEKFIIGLVGETGSGKDTVANYLRDIYGADLSRFSDPMKKALDLFFDHPSKADQAWLYMAFKQRFGEEVLHLALQRHIDAVASDVIVVNGLRMPSDLTFIHGFAHNTVVYVTAAQHLRWQRVSGRGEKSDDAEPFEIFQKFEASSETERHVPEIGAHADEKIVNEGTLEDLLARVDAIMTAHGIAKREV